METEIKIQAPEGMEIDKENSTFECIKFRPKKITYEDISEKYCWSSIIRVDSKHTEKMFTFRKLLEVADYLNGNWKPDWNSQNQIKYFISYDHINKKWSTFKLGFTGLGTVCFSSEENALKAVEIIGEEELIQFFSNTDYIL